MFRNILKVFFTVVVAFLLGVVNLCSVTFASDPPDVKQVPKTIKIHGDERNDPYYWLRERDNPEVVKYLDAENEYTEKMMMHTNKLQERLYQELLGKLQQKDTSVPAKIDSYYYYSRTEEGKDYPIYCRKKGTLEAQEEILLDINELSGGHKNFGLGDFKVSPNHQRLAYSVDTDGSESYTLFIKDLSTGKLLKDSIPNTYPSIEWAKDNQTLFYSLLDKANRPYKVYRHRLGENPSKDVLVYHERDEAFYLNVKKTGSSEYLLIQSDSMNSSEVYYLKADNPAGQIRVIQLREPNVQYGVEHSGDQFFIITNEKAKNFKIIKAPVNNPACQNWQEFLPHRNEVIIESIAVFENHLVVCEREKGLQKLRVTNLATGEFHYVEFPEPAYQVTLAAKQDYNSHLLRFTYTSLVTPRMVFDYDINSKTKEIKKQEQVQGYNPDLYQSERIFAKAEDGTMVPVSLVYKKGMLRNGDNPLLLTGYGSYGYSYPTVFNTNRLSLLDRGFIFAYAHIRGGQEMGRHWYEQGKLLSKKNTFTDFIDCAEHLINRGYTDPNKLVILGGSAGGLLMGAVTNMRPDLFKVVVAQVPFVDVLNTMSDPSLPLTVTEYGEWGNPNDKTYYDYIKSYSPYDNVKAQNYPHMLVTAGLNDPRVSYWEPAKWTARLRDTKTDTNLLLLKTQMDGGHFGSSGRYDQLKEIAFVYAFILDRLGVDFSMQINQ